MKLGNTTLIPQNIVSDDIASLVVFDSNKEKVCIIDASPLKLSDLGPVKYKAGLLSDTHTSPTDGSDSVVDLTRAVQYFAENANMLLTCGDLADENDNGGLEKHREIIDANKGELEEYEMPGNHEHYSGTAEAIVPLSDEDMKQYTGRLLYYTVTSSPTDEAARNYYSPLVGDDVFIMCGNVTWSPSFDETSINWLYQTLEKYRNQRCFLFIHHYLEGSSYCGDALDVLTWDGFGKYKSSVIALLKHYKNVIYFHGHSHCMLQMQNHLQSKNPPLPANYDFTNGTHSVHIPSTAISRNITTDARVDVVATSQGYLMEVYENHIVLRGRDFVAGEFIPIAQYCLDTTLQTVEAGTFTDSTGIITT